ncbi:hypothetical protein EVAR_86877_1 [Eumeta japonica]|uniref:Uncharacterized protein n=1 Tax=Eumeta variegata TaxID=151549 RepID=A0A4C1ZL75_EUMVA|nr:hypothetical protein EVAR_86877_1 [Eumeta japonica]
MPLSESRRNRRREVISRQNYTLPGLDRSAALGLLARDDPTRAILHPAPRTPISNKKKMSQTGDVIGCQILAINKRLGCQNSQNDSDHAHIDPSFFYLEFNRTTRPAPLRFKPSAPDAAGERMEPDTSLSPVFPTLKNLSP